ncbi:hypothetical protein P7C71_g2770, partial [Lecanoromycetidae sp. Uapishka_2]
MSIEGGGKAGPFGWHSPRYNAPVHEQMTIAALIQSEYRLDSTITFTTLRDHPTARPDINDFVRGVIWNDDPECELFDEDSNNNLSYSTGAIWSAKFGLGYISANAEKSELIGRSHFGDLQWLHSMSSKSGEFPIDTKKKVLRWMETMYKLAIGATNGDSPIQNTWMQDWFYDPSHYTTIGRLLTHGHAGPANFQHRALGSCFHIIQDSYALGHTRREPLKSGENIKYKRAILNFHTYGGQSHDHAIYDHSSNGSVENLNLNSLDSWNGLVGCREGLEACIALANYWNRKASWEEVSVWLETVVFELSRDATPGDNTVT